MSQPQNQIPKKANYTPLDQQARKKLKQSLQNRLNQKSRQQAHKKVLSPYTQISTKMQEELNKANNWAQVVAIHKRYHTAYDTTLINAFLRLYSQEAVKLHEKGPRMRGAQTMYQQWQITPQSSNQYWGPNDVIKLMGNIDQGLVDFYRSHIQFQIQVTPQMQPIGLIQVDSSAQSIIAQTVLLSNQREIQRIQQYDVLASILTDLNYVEYVCQSRSGQGLGFSNIGTSLPMQAASNSVGVPEIISSMTPNATTAQYPVRFTQGGNGFTPTACMTYGPGGTMGMSTYDTTTISTQNDLQWSPNQMGGGYGGAPQSITNWLTFNNSTSTKLLAEQTVQMNGRAAAIRAQYGIAPITSGYPDAPGSFPLSCPRVANQTWTYPNIKTEGFNPNKPYSTYYSADVSKVKQTTMFKLYSATNCAASGYLKPISSQFSPGTCQPFISATIPQCQMANGRILKQPIPIARKKFRIPLISAILGILIPPDQFQLIPAASLKNLILQISLNPYAFFTSGYSDIHEADTYGMQNTNMQKRQWMITSFNWTWHLYTFADKEITRNLEAKLDAGIVMSSCYWQCSAQYQLQNGSYVRNTFQIPVNCQSLAQVDIVFLSNEFQTKSFCRKQFRLSNNITSMQFKANGNYYPLQPILGNAGNPESIDTTGDNWEFYQLLLLANNYFMNTNTPLPKVNPKNFAINGRIYDVNNTKTYMPLDTIHTDVFPETTSNISLQLYKTQMQKLNQVNGDTALGQAWFHENRYVGKAVFTYTFEPYGHSKGMILGLDTRGYRQFDVTFNTLPNDVFPTDQTMLIFTRANIVVKFTVNGIQVMGV